MNKKALMTVLSALAFGTVSVSLAAEAPHDFGVTPQKGDGPKGIHKGGKKAGKKGYGAENTCSSEKKCGGDNEGGGGKAEKKAQKKAEKKAEKKAGKGGG